MSVTFDELEAIDPSPTQITLSTGLTVNVIPLRTRELLKFLKIITHGAGEMLTRINLAESENEQEFLSRLLSVVALSLPDSEEETLDFLNAMVEPIGLHMGRALNKQAAEANTAKWLELQAALSNPPLDDTLSIIEKIITTEGPGLFTLGNRVRTMLGVIPNQDLSK